MCRATLLLALLLALSPPAQAQPAPAVEPAPQDAGYLPYSDPQPLENINVWGALARSVMALGLVLGLMGGGLLLARRYIPGLAGGPAATPLRVVARVGLGPKQTVFLVQLPGRILVVGSGGGQLTTLGEITDAEEMAQVLQAAPTLPVGTGAVFGGVFKRYLGDAAVPAEPAARPRPDMAGDAIRRQIANLRALARQEDA